MATPDPNASPAPEGAHPVTVPTPGTQAMPPWGPGEPIFTGKFRLLPGPRFWLFAYLLLDFGSVFPYLAANAATPVAAVMLGRLPDAGHAEPTLFLFGRGITDSALLQAL